MTPLRRALLSVSDKTGVVELARALAMRGVEILSTGGTARLLSHNGVAVTEVSAHTGFPEIMGGRVKTLHPRIHGGLLGRRGLDEAVMAEHGIALRASRFGKKGDKAGLIRIQIFQHDKPPACSSAGPSTQPPALMLPASTNVPTSRDPPD